MSTKPSTRKELERQWDCLTAVVENLLISFSCCYLLVQTAVFAVCLKLQDPLIVNVSSCMKNEGKSMGFLLILGWFLPVVFLD